MDRIPIAPIREAAERRRLSCTEIAVAMDWYRRSKGHMRADERRVKRMLGMIPNTRGRPPQKTVDYENGVKLALAIGVDPVEVGV